MNKSAKGSCQCLRYLMYALGVYCAHVCSLLGLLLMLSMVTSRSENPTFYEIYYLKPVSPSQRSCG